MRPPIRVLILLGLLSALTRCSQPVNCSGLDYITACVPGPDNAATAPQPLVPVPPNPVAATPPAAASPAAATAGTVPLGDPGQFAAVDDRQCRSYGLKFGSRDYADCRIRLSAQHRGLDPNIGTPTSGAVRP